MGSSSPKTGEDGGWVAPAELTAGINSPALSFQPSDTLLFYHLHRLGETRLDLPHTSHSLTGSMMSLGMRKGKGWTLMEVERRRKVPRMMAVYTTGLTTPLNSVLMILTRTAVAWYVGCQLSGWFDFYLQLKCRHVHSQ